MTRTAAGIVHGYEGLLFLPYLTGERTPYPDPLARGAFVGLTVRHTRAHMIRSVLEGVSFELRNSMELVLGAGVGASFWKDIFEACNAMVKVLNNSVPNSDHVSLYNQYYREF